MKTFQFQFESLLKLRRNERDFHRQFLAQALHDDSQLGCTRREIEDARLTQMDELRGLEEAGQGVNIDASVSRRTYAAQLIYNLSEIDARRASLAKQIELCRQKLVRADRAVKSLEKLSEQQRNDFLFQQEREETIETEQTWVALNAVHRDRSQP
jgi:flagellar export protein FliJ